MIIILLLVVVVVVAVVVVVVAVVVVVVVYGLRRAFGAPQRVFQKFNVDKRDQPLGDSNFQVAFRSEHKQWFWDLRPSVCSASSVAPRHTHHDQ